MKVLFLTHRLPYAPNRGDRARAYHMARLLAPVTDLHVVSLVHDATEAAEADNVRQLGARVSTFEVPRWANRLRALPQLAGSRPLTHLLLDAPHISDALQRIVEEHSPDVVLAYCSGMARFAVEPSLSRFPLVLDLVDVDSVKWATLSAHTIWPMHWIYRREARNLSNFERVAVMRARHTLVVNEREADLLRAIAPQARIRVLPNGVDLAALKPDVPPCEQADVVFCGVMNYAPNVDGVRWFAREVWPLVRERRPHARFIIVGSDPVESIRQLERSDAGVTVTGTVPDVRRYLWNAAVSVAPLRTARGVQNKVLEAIAAGLPAVITSQVLEGLPREVVPACRVADTATAFANQTLALLDLSGSARRGVAAGADLSALGWEEQLAPLREILTDATRGHQSATTSST